MVGLSPTDDELLAAGDVASFEQFYRRHFEGVLAFFARRAATREQAADLTAETFAAAFVARRRSAPAADAPTRGCSRSPTTSSTTPGGVDTPSCGRCSGWAWNARS